MKNPFYSSPRLLILTLCLIFVWGLSSFQLLPRMEDPELSIWYGKITTLFPGATAERVESLVTDKIEQELLKIEEINFIDSISRGGISNVVFKLKDDVEDNDEALSTVKDSLDNIKQDLPLQASDPKFEEVNNRAYTFIVSLNWELDNEANFAILKRKAKELEDRLRSIGGVEESAFWGLPSEEILVEINPEDLSNLGLTPQQVSQIISSSDAKVSSGTIRSDENNLQIEINTELDSLERIRQIPIGSNSSIDNITYLGDIANITKNIQQPPNEISIVNGKEASVVALRIEPDLRIDKWMREVYKIVNEFEAQISPAMSLQIILDQDIYVQQRLNELFQNLLLGIICVVITTLILMGVKSALVVGIALPLSMLMVFGGLRALDIPLHQMSFTGLIIALGILIDNAIVVVDEMASFRKEGLSLSQTISKTINYLTIPLLASTLTTVLTFLPIALLPGDTGEFVSSIALSVIIALLSSLLLSLTVIPAINAWIEKGSAKWVWLVKQGWWQQGITIPQLTRFYRKILTFIFNRPLLGIFLAALLPLMGFLILPLLSEQFFPPAERNQFYIEVKLPSSASITETRNIVEQISPVIKEYEDVTDINWFLGTYVPTFYYTVSRIGIKGGVSYYGGAIIQLSSKEHARQIIKDLQKQLDQSFPSAFILVKQLEQALPVPPIEMRLYGSNLDTLQDIGNQIREILVQVPSVIHTSTTLGETIPKLALSIDEEQAKLIGMTNEQVAQQLNDYLEGTFGGTILEDTEEIPIRVRLSQSEQGNLDNISTFDLLSNDNFSQIPLSSLGKMELVPEISQITRRNGNRVNTIQGFIAVGSLASEALADFQKILASSNLELPNGYYIEWGGESAERNKAVGNLGSTVGILMVIMVAVLVLSFNSFICTGIIFCVAIGSVGLALLSLWLFNYPLGFMSILGTVGLIGVAINDSIVVIASLQHNDDVNRGDTVVMREVIIHSTRHIITTTLTTMSSFVPLFIAGGELWPPLAICVAGGVAGATLLALFFVPCIYLLLMTKKTSTI